MVRAAPLPPSTLQSLGPFVFSWGVWAEQHLSGGVFEFRSLRITRDPGEGREAGGGGVALALHKHRVQACNFGSKESMDTVEHRKEVGELQLLRNTDKERRAEFLKGAGVISPLGRWEFAAVHSLVREHPNSRRANRFHSPFQNSVQEFCTCCSLSLLWNNLPENTGVAQATEDVLDSPSSLSGAQCSSSSFQFSAKATKFYTH